MPHDVQASMYRYEAMVGTISWNNEDDPGREERDLAAYGEEYGLLRYPDGHEYVCHARTVRFLIEVCGHSYDEAVEGLVQYYRDQPWGQRRLEPNAEAEARAMKELNRNIIEELFSLKVNRMVHYDDDGAVAYSWKLTRTLMGLKGQPKLP